MKTDAYVSKNMRASVFIYMYSNAAYGSSFLEQWKLYCKACTMFVFRMNLNRPLM